MISINFNLYKAGTKFPLIMVVIRGAIQSKKLRYSSGLQIEERFWSKTKQQARTSYKNATELNNRLTEIKTRIETTFFALPLNTPENTVKEKLKNASSVLYKDVSNKKIANLKDAVTLYLKEGKDQRAATTNASRKVALEHLENYCNIRRIEFNYSIFDTDFSAKYTEYLISRKFTNNTTNLHLILIRSFLKWLVNEKGLNIIVPKLQSVKGYETECIALTEKEITSLQNIDLSDNISDREIRDIFLFQCYTGQRISDITKLQFSTAIKKTDTGTFWELRTKKTGTSLKIPMIAQAIVILERYKHLDHLPKYSETTINTSIKNIAKRANISEVITQTSYTGVKRTEKISPKHDLISTHTGRRTFITTALRNGMPTPLVMEITGHKSTSTLLRYMKIANDDLATALHNVWK